MPKFILTNQLKKMFNVGVETETGSKKIVFQVKENLSVFNLMKKIQKQEGFHIDQQRLFFEGKEMNDENKTLSDYKINSKLELVDFETTETTTILEKVKENTKLSSLIKGSSKLTIQLSEGIPEVFEMKTKEEVMKTQVNAVIHLILRLRGGMFHETSGRSDFKDLKKSIKVPKERISFYKKSNEFAFEMTVDGMVTVKDLLEELTSEHLLSLF
jgi:hypothetical protein